ncbi:MAG: acyltransferase family protein [Bacillota bacterium]|nr:acyltransferase family protein [Bacillota bacterium]
MRQQIKRSEYMDIAKGISLLAVILGHCQLGLIDQFFYIFHLPLFFIISGYFFKPYDLQIFLQKKIKSHLIPFLTCGIFLSIVEGSKLILETHSISPVYFINQFVRIVILQQRETTLWFLTTLFLGILIFYFIVKIGETNKKIFMASSILSLVFIFYDMWIGQPLLWNLDTACIIQIFLVIGYICKKQRLLEKLIDHEKKWSLALSFTSLAILFSLINYWITGKTFDMFHSSYGIFPLTISAAILLSLAILIVSKQIHSKTLSYLGQNSMVYFAFHQSVALSLALKITRKLPLPTVFNKLVLIVLVFGFCFIMDRIIQNTYLKKLMGK